MRPRFARFVLIGWLGFLVQTLAFALCASLPHMPWWAAAVVSAEVAIVHNFVWHERWTWRDRRATAGERRIVATFRRFARFNAASSVFGVVGNVALLSVAVAILGIQPLLANVFTTALLGVANFIVSDRWAFAPAACGS